MPPRQRQSGPRSRQISGNVVSSVRNEALLANQDGTPSNECRTGASGWAHTLLLSASGISSLRWTMREITVPGKAPVSVYTEPSHHKWTPSYLAGLLSDSGQFRRYKISSAVLVFQPTGDVNTKGKLVIRSAPEANDLWKPLQPSSTGAKVINLSKINETRIPLDVSTSWKPTNSAVNRLSTVPRSDGDHFWIQPVSDVNDMIFTCLDMKTTGADPNTVFGSFRLEYRYSLRSEFGS